MTLSIELLKESIFREWESDTQLRSCIDLYLIQKLRHFFKCQLATGVVYLLSVVSYLDNLAEKTFAVVHIDIIFRCARLPLYAGKPHPHKVVLRYTAFLLCFLNRDSITTIGEG